MKLKTILIFSCITISIMIIMSSLFIVMIMNKPTTTIESPKLITNNIVFGQSVCDKGFTEFDDLHQKTGKYPVIMGLDFYDLTTKRASLGSQYVYNNAIQWNTMGGISMISIHMINPQSMASVRDNNIVLADVVREGTNANRVLNEELDTIAVTLSSLQEQKITVLFRPYHEMNGGWFWWGSKNQNDFINLWRYTHDYLENKKGLHNLIWVYSPNWNWGIKDVKYYYPGNDYVDFVAIDYYGDKITTDSNLERDYQELLSLGKPFGFAEFGHYVSGNSIANYDSLTTLNALKTKYRNSKFFINYCGGWSLNREFNNKEFMNDDVITTLDEI